MKGRLMNVERIATAIITDITTTKAVQNIKNALEHYKAKGGKVTKQVVKELVKGYGQLNDRQKTNVESKLIDILA